MFALALADCNNFYASCERATTNSRGLSSLSLRPQRTKP